MQAGKFAKLSLYLWAALRDSLIVPNESCPVSNKALPIPARAYPSTEYPKNDYESLSSFPAFADCSLLAPRADFVEQY